MAGSRRWQSRCSNCAQALAALSELGVGVTCLTRGCVLAKGTSCEGRRLAVKERKGEGGVGKAHGNNSKWRGCCVSRCCEY